jgi:hypothetical protein
MTLVPHDDLIKFYTILKRTGKLKPYFRQKLAATLLSKPNSFVTNDTPTQTIQQQQQQPTTSGYNYPNIINIRHPQQHQNLPLNNQAVSMLVTPYLTASNYKGQMNMVHPQQQQPQQLYNTNYNVS